MANTNPYLTFSSPNAFTLATANGAKNWDGTLEYCGDLNLDTWHIWDGTTTLKTALMKGDGNVLYLRGTGNTTITGNVVVAENHMWELTDSNISCSGNIENLLDYSTVLNNEHPIMADGCFRDLFHGCTSLITAPEFPATTLSAHCYAGTLSGCTNLIEAPELPATTLVSNCYAWMFDGCSSLMTVPKLPATTLAKYCYDHMFQNCISLTEIPKLPVTGLAERCYGYMFSGCINIKLSTTKTEKYLVHYRIPSSGTGVTATNALLDMFTGTGGTFAGTPDINTIYYLWTEIYPDRALKLSSDNSFTLATANSTKNWDGILQYSTDLANWSTWDGTTTLNSSSESPYVLYLRGTGNSVISGGLNKGWTLTGTNISCSGNIENLLNHETVTAGGHPSMGSYCYTHIFKNCTSLTTAPKLPATTLALYCYLYMFWGCTNLTTSPELPATTLANSCYLGMFHYCTNLTTPPELPATTLTPNCYESMFWGCTSLTSAPELPATTLAASCYYDMFNGCTSLAIAPELPATTLALYCYRNMFKDCTSLATAPELPATMLTDNCYYSMFKGCTNLLHIPYLKANILTSNCYNSMFANIGITISETKTSTTPYPYRVPLIGDGTTATDALTNMFSGVTGNIPTPEINKTYYLSHKPIGGLEVKEVKKGDDVIDIKHYHIYTDSTLTENAYTDSAFGAEALYDAYGMTDTEYNTLIALIG